MPSKKIWVYFPKPALDENSKAMLINKIQTYITSSAKSGDSKKMNRYSQKCYVYLIEKKYKESEDRK